MLLKDFIDYSARALLTKSIFTASNSILRPYRRMANSMETSNVQFNPLSGTRRLDAILELLKNGPKFPYMLGESRLANLCSWYYRTGCLARSSSKHEFVIQQRWKKQGFAYVHPSFQGQTLTWEYEDEQFSDKFVLNPTPRARDLHYKPDTPLQNVIVGILHANGALFAQEIWQVAMESPGRKTSLKNTRHALRKLLRKGKVVRFDDRRGGWKYTRGFLYALPDMNNAFSKRIESLDPKIVTDTEKALVNQTRGALWLGKDLRAEICMEESLLTWILRKLGKEGPYQAKTSGKGKDYRIEVVKEENRVLEGRGLIPWLKWPNIFVNIIVYDDQRVPEKEIVHFVQRIGYWASAEGLKRLAVGQEWERYSENFFDLCDANGEWQIKVLEHRKNCRTRSGNELDHVYICRLGSKEIGLRIHLIFECKAGVVTSMHVDEFYQKLIAEGEFRNFATGGLKCNVVPVILSGKTADQSALRKAAQMGMRIVFHTSIEEVMRRLTGEKTSFYKTIQKEVLAK